jgi:hypothetical protein
MMLDLSMGRNATPTLVMNDWKFLCDQVKVREDSRDLRGVAFGLLLEADGCGHADDARRSTLVRNDSGETALSDEAVNPCETTGVDHLGAFEEIGFRSSGQGLAPPRE